MQQDDQRGPGDDRGDRKKACEDYTSAGLYPLDTAGPTGTNAQPPRSLTDPSGKIAFP